MTASEIITRKAALASGATHYFTGRRCRNGHLDRRFVSTRICVSCGRAASRAAARVDPERHRESVKRSRRKNPEAHREYQKRWYHENRADVMERKRARKYGLTEGQFDQMLTDQNHQCLGCNRSFDDTPQVDHCHTTGAVRGLLCGPCNRALAMADDDPKTLRRLADYLENHSGEAR